LNPRNYHSSTPNSSEVGYIKVVAVEQHMFSTGQKDHGDRTTYYHRDEAENVDLSRLHNELEDVAIGSHVDYRLEEDSDGKEMVELDMASMVGVFYKDEFVLDEVYDLEDNKILEIRDTVEDFYNTDIGSGS